LYINDITDGVQSTIRLFADDSILYREIRNPVDHSILQEDLNTIFNWADTWQISFNASKCQHLSITRKIKQSHFNYKVAQQVIEKTTSHKYLGVTITSDLSWNEHVANLKSKACSTLGVIRRNLGPCSQNVKLRAYQTLVRPQLEYAAAAWNPHTAKNIASLESVQRQAVRYICGIYDWRASITPHIEQLGLDHLAVRRTFNQCTMFFKIHNNLVNVSFPPCVRLHPTPGRTSHHLRYHPVLSTRDTFMFSFFVRTIPIWNRLPWEVVTAPSDTKFQALALPSVRAMQPTATHQQI
jgi:hypothetical protein